ncbi:hypothetical protein M426DRAFT_264887 [Hypoxylon sp. CI-4A]|nr:hypothetical protein M426DRAFT_264887 [Hypoxylon sp. CI-4A]
MAEDKSVNPEVIVAHSGVGDPEAVQVNSIMDEAGALAVTALTAAPVDEEASRQVRRKIDLYILPFLCVTFALQFIVQASLSYASDNLWDSDILHGNDDYWLLVLFYFGFLAAVFPGLALMHKAPLAKSLGINIVIWGAILLTTMAASSFGGLAALRFNLGMAVATNSPGLIAITGIWWTREEQAIRTALWVSFLGVGDFVGTLAGYGMGQIHGSLSTWKYVYLILGVITIVWGVIFTIFVPDGPAGVKWLDENEKIVAVQRVITNKTGTRSRRFVKYQAVEALVDPQVLILGLMCFVNTIPAGALDFGSLGPQSFSLSPLEEALLYLPLSAIRFVAPLACGLLISRFPISRLRVATLAMIPPIIGAALIDRLYQSNKWGWLVGVWMQGFSSVGFMVIVSLLSTNIAGSTKRLVVWGWVFACYCIGRIAGPYFFGYAPDFSISGGITVMLCGFVLSMIFSQALRYLYTKENKIRDATLEGKSDGEIALMEKESDTQGFEDDTDKHNAMFRYAL